MSSLLHACSCIRMCESYVCAHCTCSGKRCRWRIFPLVLECARRILASVGLARRRQSPAGVPLLSQRSAEYRRRKWRRGRLRGQGACDTGPAAAQASHSDAPAGQTDSGTGRHYKPGKEGGQGAERRRNFVLCCFLAHDDRSQLAVVSHQDHLLGSQHYRHHALGLSRLQHIQQHITQDT